MPAAATRTPQRIVSGDLTLEGELILPRRPTGRAVFCHPYPPMGGNMDNGVVLAACRAFAGRGIAVLRFNFRGVGASEGRFDGGRGELEDVRAALRHVRGLDLAEADRTWLGGYSFGAMMAAAVAAGEPDLAGIVLVSPPTRMFDPASLGALAAPLLVVAGERDDFCDVNVIAQAVADRAGATLVREPDADHFWFGTEDRVEAAIARFVG